MINKHSEPMVEARGYINGRFLSPCNTIGWMSAKINEASGEIRNSISFFGYPPRIIESTVIVSID